LQQERRPRGAGAGRRAWARCAALRSARFAFLRAALPSAPPASPSSSDSAPTGTATAAAPAAAARAAPAPPHAGAAGAGRDTAAGTAAPAHAAAGAESLTSGALRAPQADGASAGAGRAAGARGTPACAKPAAARMLAAATRRSLALGALRGTSARTGSGSARMPVLLRAPSRCSACTCCDALGCAKSEQRLCCTKAEQQRQKRQGDDAAQERLWVRADARRFGGRGLIRRRPPGGLGLRVLLDGGLGRGLVLDEDPRLWWRRGRLRGRAAISRAAGRGNQGPGASAGPRAFFRFLAPSLRTWTGCDLSICAARRQHAPARPRWREGRAPGFSASQ